MNNLKYSVLLYIVISTAIHKAISFPPLVQTNYGLVEGTIEVSKANASVTYFSFMGIPYALPPVGNLRFKKPLPPKRWAGIRKANKQAIECVQLSYNSNEPDVVGREDCLYLNIFVPHSQDQQIKTLMPVLFWIHGGVFTSGSTVEAGPDYVMEREVIVVSIQYRLNVFGFLSTLDKYAPGNCGLKDQVMALQWVKENIQYFGGNPQRVTIIGESAGGKSVHYHLLSPKSKGLFQRAISHSGSTLSRSSHQPYPLQMVRRVAKGLGISNLDSKSLVQQLQKINYRTLIRASFNSSIVGFYTPYDVQPFGPVIEEETESAFISTSTYDLLKNGNFSKVPYLTGHNTEEGSFAYSFVANGRVDINRYEENPLNILPVALNIPRNSACAEEIVNQIKKFYFKGGPLNHKAKWINFMSYELYVRSIRKTVELMHSYLPLYYYRFSYSGSRNESFLGGVGHREELMYLWRSRVPGANTVESEVDLLTRKRLVTMWTNFAATGNPTPKFDSLLQHVKWPTVTSSHKVAFMDIGDDLIVGENPNQKDYLFWEHIFEVYGNPPYTSY